MKHSDMIYQFLRGAGIEDDTEDSVMLGHLTPSLAPVGIDAVMHKHTSTIDALIQQLPKNSVKRIQMQIIRGFTYNEFLSLFDAGIKEKDFHEHPVFKSLFITSERQRKKWLVIYALTKEYDDYLFILAKSLSPFAPQLVSFFFPKRRYGKNFCEEKFGTTCAHCRKKWSRKIKTHGNNVLRHAT